VSAFITMFRKALGKSPAKYLRDLWIGQGVNDGLGRPSWPDSRSASWEPPLKIGSLRPVNRHRILGVLSQPTSPKWSGALAPFLAVIDNCSMAYCDAGWSRSYPPHPLWRGRAAETNQESNGVCGWLPHCKRFLAISAVIFVSTVVCPACLCFGIASTGPDEFRKRGSNRLIDLKGPLPFPECPCSWL